MDDANMEDMALPEPLLEGPSETLPQPATETLVSRDSTMTIPWRDHIERRKARKARKKETADAKELQRWDSRDVHALYHEMPGARGPTVWAWKPNANGVLVRVRVP
jgi:hypothetical protein